MEAEVFGGLDTRGHVLVPADEDEPVDLLLIGDGDHVGDQLGVDCLLLQLTVTADEMALDQPHTWHVGHAQGPGVGDPSVGSMPSYHRTRSTGPTLSSIWVRTNSASGW